MNRRAILLLVLPIPAYLPGQVAISVRAGLVYHIEGQVSAGDSPLDPTSLKLRQLENGERLETRRGRAEVLLGPGQFVRLSPRARITLISDDISAPEFRLEHGSAIVSWKSSAKGEPVAIQTSAGVITIPKPGLYRLDALEPPATRLRVYEGRAVVLDGSRAVSSKRELDLAQAAAPEKFDPEQLDGFDRWSRRRDRVVEREERAGRGRRGTPDKPSVSLPDASERGLPRTQPSPF